MEPSIDNMQQTSVKSINTQKMIDEHIQPDTFKPPLHIFLVNVRKSLSQLLETFKSQFAQGETSIGTSHLTEMQIDTGNSEPVSQRPYPIIMCHYDWVKNEINKLLNGQVFCSSHSSWSAPIIVVPMGNGRKYLAIDNRALNKVTWKLVLPLPNKTMLNTSQLLISGLGFIKYPSMKTLSPKQLLHLLENMST